MAEDRQRIGRTMKTALMIMQKVIYTKAKECAEYYFPEESVQ